MARSLTLSPLVTVLGVALAAVSCSDTTAPAPGTLRPSEVRLKSGLAIAVSATPSAVAAGDPVTVRTVVRNPTSAAVRVVSGCTTLATVGLSRTAPPAEIPADAPFSTGCGAALTPFTLAAGDSVVYADQAPTTSAAGAPLPAGTYYAYAYSNVGGDIRTGPADGAVANVSAALVIR